MQKCLIGLGSNQGDRHHYLDRAIELLVQHPHIEVTTQSRWYETSPIGGPSKQGDYLNGAVLLETSLEPPALLDALQAIERLLGRQRDERWGSRPIDLDLLLYDDRTVQSERLMVPHPRMAFRGFVLEPASEIAGDMLHPTSGWTISRLQEHLRKAINYVALAGPIGVGKTHLAQQLAKSSPVEISAEISVEIICEKLNAELLEHFYDNSVRHAWATEVEFLEQRGQLLKQIQEAEEAEPSRIFISDFWLDQSLAFAKISLDSPQFETFSERFSAINSQVIPPKLLIVLDAPNEVLLTRIAHRARPYEKALDAEYLGHLRRRLEEQVSASAQGPVLQLEATDPKMVFDETQAAIRAMTMTSNPINL